ncbi:MAG TPA: hypothetical protein VGQ49_13460 [Bryobacteraceae bacterium]|nr:hypothetical protein [Bryobacteraceae bacterium]
MLNTVAQKAPIQKHDVIAGGFMDGLGDKKFGPLSLLSIEILLPSLIAGALAAYCNPKLTKDMIAELGATLVPIVTLSIGFIIYIFYRVILGEWALYPFRHGLHRILCWVSRKTNPEAFLSFTALLAAEGVPRWRRRLVYSQLRAAEDFFDESTRQRLDLTHATYHCLYLTAVETGVASAYLHLIGSDWKVLASIAGISLIAAYIADLRFDSWECKLMLAKRDKLRQLLAGMNPVATGLAVGSTSHQVSSSD